MSEFQYSNSVYEIMETRADGTPYLPPYAWPGGYEIIYLCADGEVVCNECAILNIFYGEFNDPRTNVIAYDIFYEGPPEYCAHCNKEIESAYGDPEENEILEAISEITRENDCVSHAPLFRAKHVNPYDTENKWLVSDDDILKQIMQLIANATTGFYDNLPNSALEHITQESIIFAISYIESELREGN